MCEIDKMVSMDCRDSTKDLVVVEKVWWTSESL